MKSVPDDCRDRADDQSQQAGPVHRQVVAVDEHSNLAPYSKMLSEDRDFLLGYILIRILTDPRVNAQSGETMCETRHNLTYERSPTQPLTRPHAGHVYVCLITPCPYSAYSGGFWAKKLKQVGIAEGISRARRRFERNDPCFFLCGEFNIQFQY